MPALTGTVLTGDVAEVGGSRRGRPPGTSRRELELMFGASGFAPIEIGQAGQVRQAEVEDQRGVAGRLQDGLRITHVREHVYVESGALQSLGEKLPKFLVVLDDQQSHAPAIILITLPVLIALFSRRSQPGLSDETALEPAE